jgi:hypothetical protein
MFFNNEKEVEFFYWTSLEKLGKQLDKNFKISAANKTDGYFEAGNIKSLSEIKYDLDFSNNANVARVIIQALYYIKNRQKLGQEVPSSIFVGDKDEYFIVSVKQFANFLDDSYVNEMDPEWKFSPSSAYKLNIKMYQELFNKDIPLMIKKLQDTFDFDFVRNRLVALASNENIKTKLNAETIKKPFHYFTQSVLLNGESIKDHAKIKLFFAIITGSEDAIYSRGKVRYEGKDYSVHDGYYAGFVNIYQTKYKTSERENFVASMDSLIKEEARRFHGAYFTPKIIVDYAHETIAKNLGENWKDEYVVWDPAAGTLNLTRDYQFKELYCSTLFQEELDLASDYNPEAVKFQFDFLNDEFKAERDGGKVPNGLYDAVNDENKKVMVLMNPPYASSGTGQGSNLKSKNKNKQKSFKIMEKMGLASRDLYCNFIYKIKEIFKKEVFSALFTPTTHLRSSSYIKFRNFFLEKSNHLDNFAFDSSYFEGASGGWPVMFSIDLLNTKESLDTYERFGNFIEIKNNKIEKIKKHLFYSVEKKNNIINWIKEPIKNESKINEVICLSMPTTVKKIKKHKKINNMLGDVAVKPFVAGYSGDRGIYSVSYSNNPTHCNINKNNFYRVSTYNVIRALIKPNIFNSFDDFIKPNENNSSFEEFKYDSLVLSLFENKSYQSSLRKVGYDSQGNPINYPTASQKGNINVYNEWFFLSQSEISDLADEHFSEVYQDAKGQKDRYVYTELERLISENKLSKEALDVLEAGRKLFKDTFSVRQTLHTQFPEYHLNAWDAGFWQLRTALKKAGLESHLEDLNKKYEILENKMRPLVYELGFLKQ